MRDILIWILLALAIMGWGGACAERTRAGVLSGKVKRARKRATRSGMS